MIRILRQRLSGMILTLTLLIATVATGFGHQVMSADDVARAQHALFWGQPAADLCGSTDGRDGTATGMAGCAVCQLVGAAVLPPPVAQPTGLALRLVAVAQRPGNPAPVLAGLDLAHPVRAPPLA
ncbi:MAG: hypothetical protein Q8Q26_11540 [Pseudorhodobacter sp.]|nr:hypothetical protein [Pseudorhodobacter sp.]